MASDWPRFLSLAAVLVTWVFAALLWRWSDGRRTARLLSSLMVIEGVVLSSSFAGLFAWMTVPREWVPILRALHYSGDAAIIALYPLFLARALRTSLAQPFRRPSVAILWITAAAVLLLLALLDEARWTLLGGAVTAVFLWAVLVSLANLREARAPLARQQARLFVLAFGVRDVVWGIVYLGATTGLLPLGGMAAVLYAGSLLVYVPVVAYGVLRMHMFDIDLRIKVALRSSTVAAAFVAVFFVVSEGASGLLSSWLGNVLGLAVAGLLIFAMAPLVRVAERFADAALPGVQPTSEYEAFRKLQVYHAALEEALGDGVVSAPERAMLERLREMLQIKLDDARRLESDLAS